MEELKPHLCQEGGRLYPISSLSLIHCKKWKSYRGSVSDFTGSLSGYHLVNQKHTELNLRGSGRQGTTAGQTVLGPHTVSVVDTLLV